MLAMRMMKERRYFLLACQLGILGILVVWNNVFGLDPNFNFYERVWGWDIVSHILGGLWVGLFTAWCAVYVGRRVTVLQCVAAAVIVGAGWEVYEYFIGVQFTTYPWPIEVEILKDLVDDAAGGAIAGFVASKRRL